MAIKLTRADTLAAWRTISWYRMNYERRIVAFIDILSFKAQISGTLDKDRDVAERPLWVERAPSA